jgi:hypothetical protein
MRKVVPQVSRNRSLDGVKTDREPASKERRLIWSRGPLDRNVPQDMGCIARIGPAREGDLNGGDERKVVLRLCQSGGLGQGAKPRWT